MARIPYVTEETIPQDAKETFAKLAPMNLFKMMAHSGKMLDRYIRLGNFILTKSKLDPVLREIAILRVGYISEASYETYQHERISRDIGMTDEFIAAIKEGPDASAFDPLQRLVMRYCDDVIHNVRASDKTFNPLQEHLSVAELQELTLTIGFYMMTCRFLETFDIDIEDTPVDPGVG
jgi:4-carboxymuconolactone decarboxylase